VNNKMSFFNPLLPNPVAGGIPGALQFSGNGVDSCNCATPVQQHWLDFAPRIGIAYRLRDKTVIRAFYGMFYAHAGGVGGRTNGRQGISQLGFNNNGNLTSATTGQPAYMWDSGYPGNPINPPFINPSYGIGFISASAPGAAAIGAGPTTAQTMSYGDPFIGGIPPNYQDFSLNIQHSFTPNMVLSVAYSGSVGHHLAGAGVAGPLTNQIPVQYLPLQALLTTTLSPASLASAQAILTPLGIKIPWAAAGVPFPNFVGQIGQALKPFPQYNGISDVWSDVGNSAYHSLQVTFNRRMSHGLTFMMNYTYSKELDDIAGVRFPGRDDLERGPGTIDHPNVASATFVWLVPVGAGHSWNPGNKIASQVISNWEFSGIYTFSQGAPLTVTATCTGGGIIDASCYPNLTPGFTGSIWQNGTPGKTSAPVSTTAFLNKAAFTDPAAFTIGNAPRTAPYGLFAPLIEDVDLSIRREFPIHESLRFAFQVDAFNINNAVHFAAPNTNIDAAAFGTFTSQANQARKLQFSARLTF
jgi:hypothetical protein